MSAETLPELLEARAQKASGKVTFLGLREDEAPIPMADFALQAGRISAALHRQGLKKGDLVALLLPSDLNFARLFLGIAAAGMVPVPLYPPTSLARMDYYLHNLEGILSTFKPAAMVVDPQVKPVLDLLPKEKRAGARVLSAAELLAGEATPRFEPVGTDALAFIQCTSGSTSVPKPVMIRQSNLFANLGLLIAHAGDHADDGICLWLPMYHDMGLLGLLRPILGNHNLVLMEPQTFLRRPVRWLHGFSRHGATFAGGPNFAYELLVRKVTDAERQGLDLSRWRYAYNGAEPIRVGTVRRFLTTYAPYGLRADVPMPCYGMSETTLTATVPRQGQPWMRVFERASITAGQVVEVETTEAELPDHLLGMAALGQPLPGHEVVVCDPDKREILPEGRVGIVALTGPSVSSGYLNLPERTAQSFQKWFPGDDRVWLRTNDFGFFYKGDLFIIGREDDVIILRGRKLHPVDLEAAVETIDGIRGGCTAAVRLDPPAEQGDYIFVAETTRAPDAALESAIKEMLANRFQATPTKIIFVPTGSIPKTSSGKISRSGIRRLYTSGKLVTEKEPEWLVGLKFKARVTASRVKKVFGG